jgi:hypothetical protein
MSTVTAPKEIIKKRLDNICKATPLHEGKTKTAGSLLIMLDPSVTSPITLQDACARFAILEKGQSSVSPIKSDMSSNVTLRSDWKGIQKYGSQIITFCKSLDMNVIFTLINKYLNECDPTLGLKIDCPSTIDELNKMSNMKKM